MATPSTPETARHTDRPGATIDPDLVWVPPKQIPDHCPGESVGGVRWAIFNERTNGLAESGAVVRRGRKVLVNPKRWVAWTRSNPTLSPPKPKAGEKVAPRARPQYRPQPVATLAAE